MYFGEKVVQVFKEIIKLLSLFVWKLGFDVYKWFFGWETTVESMGELLLRMLSCWFPALLITWLFGWFCRLFNAPPLSLLYKPNKNYGNVSSYERTKTVTHDVYNSSGSKVGTVKTDEGTETVYTEDTRKYVPRYLRMFLYFFYFPINRVSAVFFSIVALFTKKFYVRSNWICREMGDTIKYNRTLYTLFNIVYERSLEKVEKLKKKLEEEKALQKSAEKRKEAVLDTFFSILYFVFIVAVAGGVVYLLATGSCF